MILKEIWIFNFMTFQHWFCRKQWGSDHIPGTFGFEWMCCLDPRDEWYSMFTILRWNDMIWNWLNWYWMTFWMSLCPFCCWRRLIRWRTKRRRINTRNWGIPMVPKGPRSQSIGVPIWLRHKDSEWVHCSGGVVQHQQFQSIQIIENRLKIKRN